jgi:hypothetical protein
MVIEVHLQKFQNKAGNLAEGSLNIIPSNFGSISPRTIHE